MEWKCKLCAVSSDTRAQLFRHYHLKHSHYSRVSPLPCLYDSCICTFQSFNALKIHLSRIHKDTQRTLDSKGSKTGSSFFTCPLCGLKEPFSESNMFCHLRSHLKNYENVTCPFKNCTYHTNVYSSFNAHKSRKHSGSLEFCDHIVLIENDSSLVTSTADLNADDPVPCWIADTSTSVPEAENVNIGELRAQLHHNLSSLFLKMQTVLHVSDMACQEIVDHLSEIFSLSQPLIKDTIKEILQQHHVSPTEAVLNDLVNAVNDTNIFVSATAKDEDLSSNKRRKTHFEKTFPVVKPVQYVLEPGRTVVYVPIQMIQEIFKHTDVLDRIKETKASQEGHYMSHKDGKYFQENTLLSSSELSLPLILYIDDLEIANPLGTSRKIHKLCSVYWMFADLPSKYRSALHVIQLAALCKVEESDEPDITGTPLALVMEVTENTGPVCFNPARTAVVVEDEFVLSDIPTFPEAFVLLFGLMYALHLDYPRKLIHTFTFIQKMLMGLDDGKPLKPCLLNLKNELLRTL